ncbi:MAG: class I SAM-dependent methyltransferase [candidate division Zixibacteria bacterium]
MGLISFTTLHRKLGIKRSDIVIDIGSGNNPILRADILVEKYVFSDRERYSGLIMDRPVVSADGARLPFRDKSIDFVHCSHVLEHVPDPAAFLDEIQRVGKRGIIVTPHGDYEKIDPRDQHLWYVWNQKERLILKQKTRWNEYREISKYFFNIIGNVREYWKLFDKYYELFNTIYLWEDKIDYEISGDSNFDFSLFNKASEETTAEAGITLQVSSKAKLKSHFASAVRSAISAPFNFNDLLCCPKCHSDLKKNSGLLACPVCQREFKSEGNLVIMNIET